MSAQEREACVDAFAAVMKQKLAENAHKGDREGWRRDSAGDLLDRVQEELDELVDEVTELGGKVTRPQAARVVREAADVANMAMMVADVCGGLDVAPDEGRALAAYERLAADRTALRAALADIVTDAFPDGKNVFHASGCRLSRYSPDDCGGECVLNRARAALAKGGGG